MSERFIKQVNKAFYEEHAAQGVRIVFQVGYYRFLDVEKDGQRKYLILDHVMNIFDSIDYYECDLESFYHFTAWHSANVTGVEHLGWQLNSDNVDDMLTDIEHFIKTGQIPE